MADNAELKAINAAVREGEKIKRTYQLSDTDDVENPMVVFGAQWIIYIEKRESVGCTIIAFDRTSTHAYITVFDEEKAGLEYADVLEHLEARDEYNISFAEIGGQMFMIVGIYSYAKQKYIIRQPYGSKPKKYSMRLATHAETCAGTRNVTAFVHRQLQQQESKRSDNIASLLSALQ